MADPDSAGAQKDVSKLQGQGESMSSTPSSAAPVPGSGPAAGHAQSFGVPYHPRHPSSQQSQHLPSHTQYHHQQQQQHPHPGQPQAQTQQQEEGVYIDNTRYRAAPSLSHGVSTQQQTWGPATNQEDVLVGYAPGAAVGPAVSSAAAVESVWNRRRPELSVQTATMVGMSSPVQHLPQTYQYAASLGFQPSFYGQPVGYTPYGGAYLYSYPQPYGMYVYPPSVVGPGPPIQTTEEGQGPAGCNLFVFHIPNDMTNQDLYNYFAVYGNVISARIMVEKDSGRSRGFGFVSYDNPQSAEAAIEAMNGFQLGRKRLKVQHKKEENRRSRGPSRNQGDGSSSGSPVSDKGAEKEAGPQKETPSPTEE